MEEKFGGDAHINSDSMLDFSKIKIGGRMIK